MKLLKRYLILITSVIVLIGMSANAELQIHFLDVGEADCSILVADGEAMVIDGGNAEDSALVYSYLTKTLGLTHLKAVIATHPHEDHVGGLAGVMNACSVDNVYSIVREYPESQRFTTFLKYTAMQNIDLTVPEAGSAFNIGGAQVSFVSPLSVHEDMNDNSIVVRVTYGSTAFLFMADAGKEAEKELIACNRDISADVVRIGHHGSSSATTKEFLNAVNPEYAVISVGADNDQNHPSPKVLDILKSVGIAVLRTDRFGTIICRSDGENIIFENVRTPKTDSYDSPFVGNMGSMKFHKTDCKWARNISDSNRVPFETAEQALHEGFEACKVCRPK